MAAQDGYNGRLVLLKVGDENGQTIAGLRETSYTVNGEPVDFTNKDCNGFVGLLEGAGRRSLQITASGVTPRVSNMDTLRTFADSQSINEMTLLYDNDSATSTALQGNFLISTLEETGNENDAQSFSITLDSSGQWSRFDTTVVS